MIEIYKFLYTDATIYLKRKQEKFEKYFKYRANFINNNYKVV